MRRRSLIRDYLDALLVAVVLAVFARTFLLQAFSIPTGSMEGNLQVGDHVLVNKFVFAPASPTPDSSLLPNRRLRRGDVVVFKFPGDPVRDFIKRCVGLPGDRIEIRDKTLLVNDHEVEDGSFVLHRDPHVYPSSHFLDESFRQRDNFGPYLVPAGHYFFLGDNRDHSNDSRFWGPVPASHIKGRALFVYWSFDSAAAGSPVFGWWGQIRAGGRTALGILTRTRWDRCFRLIR